MFINAEILETLWIELSLSSLEKTLEKGQKETSEISEIKDF